MSRRQARRHGHPAAPPPYHRAAQLRGRGEGPAVDVRKITAAAMASLALSALTACSGSPAGSQPAVSAAGGGATGSAPAPAAARPAAPPRAAPPPGPPAAPPAHVAAPAAPPCSAAAGAP